MSEYNLVVINWACRARPAGPGFLIVNLGVPWTYPWTSALAELS